MMITAKDIREFLNYDNPPEHKIRMAKIMLDVLIEQESKKKEQKYKKEKSK